MGFIFKNLQNGFDFYLRRKITISRKNYIEQDENLDDVEIDDYIKQKYNTEFLKPSARRIYLENLYFLSVFDKYFSKKDNKHISILDIGSKNWSYVKGEYLYFNSFANDFMLNGIELDAYRLNDKFYSRYEIAKFHTKNLTDTNYIAGDFMEHSQKYDYIVWILPFITEYPLLRWGLPLKYFKPKEMLLHAYELLNIDGEMLIINQGEEEYKIQQNLCSQLNLPSEKLGQIEDKYSLFKNKRFCSKIIK